MVPVAQQLQQTYNQIAVREKSELHNLFTMMSEVYRTLAKENEKLIPVETSFESHLERFRAVALEDMLRK